MHPAFKLDQQRVREGRSLAQVLYCFPRPSEYIHMSLGKGRAWLSVSLLQTGAHMSSAPLGNPGFLAISV